MSEYWGYHMMADCRGCERDLITNRAVLEQFIYDLVSDIDMVAYGEPTIEHFATHDPGKAGYSLVQLIETSSITGHFVDATGEAYIDVFSCKPFDVELVKCCINGAFKPTAIKVHFITRQA
jgi:S-adenosylmethionine/arginine decarboxylase-like enzyme